MKNVLAFYRGRQLQRSDMLAVPWANESLSPIEAALSDDIAPRRSLGSQRGVQTCRPKRAFHSVILSRSLWALRLCGKNAMFIRLPRRSSAKAGVHPWLKTSFLPNEPKLKIISYCLYVGCVKTVWLRFPKRTHFPCPWSFKVFQRLSKRFKAFQRVWRKKIIFPENLGGLRVFVV